MKLIKSSKTHHFNYKQPTTVRFDIERAGAPRGRLKQHEKHQRLKFMPRSDLPALTHSFMDCDHCTENESGI